jgi:ribonuclease P protein component
MSVVVSKKIARTAVVRNRVKRRMRAAADGSALRRALVIIAKSGAVSARTEDFRKELTTQVRSGV